jgi:phosphotransferase system enzyme I (PtsI)
LLRAAIYGDLRILVPLITVMEEIREFRKLVAEVSIELRDEGMDFREDVPVGIMIEVPAAALIADLLAEEADFFSIGTNDLIQYSLAVDRNNEHVTNLYQPLHPAMLRLLGSVIRAAEEARIPLSVCGEMAGDSLHAIALLGLGVRRFSMSPRRVPTIKNAFRQLDTTGLQDILEDCQSLRTSSEVEKHLRAHLAEHSEEKSVRRKAMAP